MYLICQRPNGDKKPINQKENQDESCSEVITLLHEANCCSVSSVKKYSIPTSAALRNSFTFREFVPPLKEVVYHDEKHRSYVTHELK